MRAMYVFQIMAEKVKNCKSEARTTHSPLGHRELPSSLAVVPPSTMYTKDVTRSETLSQYTMRSEAPRWVGIRW